RVDVHDLTIAIPRRPPALVPVHPRPVDVDPDARTIVPLPLRRVRLAAIPLSAHPRGPLGRMRARRIGMAANGASTLRGLMISGGWGSLAAAISGRCRGFATPVAGGWIGLRALRGC